MNTSPSLNKLAAALVKAQTAITFAAKDATNPHFRSKYADLPAVIDAVKPALNANGIAFVQTPSPSDDGKLHLTTRLVHESGEWIEDTAVCPLPKADPQGFGSAMTYLRRYSLAAMTGLYQDDDDGNGASANAEPKAAAAKTSAKASTTKAAPAARTATKAAPANTAQLSDRDALSEYMVNEATAWAVKELLSAWDVKTIADLPDEDCANGRKWVETELNRAAKTAAKA